MGDVIPFRKKSETGDQPERIKASLERINDLIQQIKDTNSFAEEVERNRKNEERLKREREKANKGVLRSYRIKGPE